LELERASKVQSYDQITPTAEERMRMITIWRERVDFWRLGEYEKGLRMIPISPAVVRSE